jgi:hypothetical protein
VIRTNEHSITTRTRKQWRWAETTQRVETQRIKVAATNLERIPRWNMRGLAEGALRSIRR